MQFKNNNTNQQMLRLFLFQILSFFQLKKKLRIIYFLKPHFYFFLFIVFAQLSFSQENLGGTIQKSKNITTISGVKFYLHVVEKGQTLFAIAKCYDLNLNDIVIENPEAINGIKPGQIIKVPEKKISIKIASQPLNDKSNFIEHKVEPGQTLYSIARQFDVSIETIKILNPELVEGLKAGQNLRMPILNTKVVSENNTISNSNLVEKKVNNTETNKSLNSIVPSKTEKNTTLSPVVVGIIKPTENIKNISVIPVVNTDTIKIMGPQDSLSTYLLKNKPNTLDSVKSNVFEYKGELKDEYSIAFFLPFNADTANKINMELVLNGEAMLPNKTLVALQFYEGALLAIDSLKKQKLNAKIFIYDIDDRDSLSIINILKKPELKKMDLIIGPLYGSSFIAVAVFAKEYSIPIVSPFTQINKILFNNPYVCKVLPSNILQVEQMAQFVIDTFKTQNIILVNNGNSKEISFYNAFKNSANKALRLVGSQVADTLKEAKNSSIVESMLLPDKINVIVLPSNNQSYVTDFISKFSALIDKNKIKLFGLQSWLSFDNLDFEYLNNLAVHIPSNNFINFQDSTTQNFIKLYHEKFKTDPELYAYQGFDISYYFISSLHKYGSGFLKNITENKFTGIETNFNFTQFPLNSGFENKYVFILKYQDNKLVKAN